MTTVEEKAASAERPDVGDIQARPASPAVIRFLGCEAEMAGLSTDYFTAGRTDDSDLALPKEMGGDPSIVLRFSRGAEGWRVSPSDNQPIFVNQEQVRGLTSLRSGDVIRFEPGGAGMQFSIVHQNATPLANLVAKYAPRLLGGEPETLGEQPPGSNDSVVDGMSPLRYEAGGRTRARTAADVAAPDESRRKLDPAVLVAASILTAGFVAAAAFLYSNNSPPAEGDNTNPPAATNNEEKQSPKASATSPLATEEPDEPSLEARTSNSLQEEAKEDFGPRPEAKDTATPEQNEVEAPASEDSTPTEPDDDPFSDL